MQKKIFCSLDLESTGLDTSRDHIIEVGAVLFEITAKGEIKYGKEFSQLIKPPIPIPPFIQDLTNIRQEQVEDAPSWEEVRPKFQKFVSDHVIVGQNVQFDINFLSFHGLPLPQKFVDTKELAEMMLPSARFYNLEYLLRYFDTPIISHHRALDDSKSAAILLEKIIEYYHSLPFDLQEKISSLLKPSGLSYSQLFLPKKSKKIAPPVSEQPTLFTQEKFVDISGADKEPISGIVDKLLAATSINFADLADKGLSEEVASRLLVKNPEKKAVVSVGSQETLKNLSRVAEKAGWTVLGEEKNYFCPVRFSELLSCADLPPALIKFLIKLLVWREIKKDTDDLSSLTCVGEEFLFRELVAGNFGSCGRHSEKDSAACALHEAFKKISQGQKIFTTHKSWLEFIRRFPVEKISESYWFDIAELEEARRAATTRVVAFKPLRTQIATLYSPETKTGLFASKLSSAQRKICEDTINVLDLNFGLMGMTLTEDASVSSERILDESFLESETFSKLKKASEAIGDQLEKILVVLKPYLSKSPSAAGDLLEKIEEVKIFFLDFFTASRPSEIHWLEFFADRLKFKIMTGDFDYHRLGQFDKFVFSGDLAAQKVKEYYRALFKITDAQNLKFGEARPSVELLLPESFSAGFKSINQSAVKELLVKLTSTAVGRVLVIFNSQKSLDATYNSLDRTKNSVPILAQRLTGHQWKNLETFTQSKNAVWFVTVQNFLKNTDQLPPTDVLILLRLPYEIPGVMQAMYDADEVFSELILPKTVIRLNKVVARFTNSGETARAKKMMILDPRFTEDYNEPLLSGLSQRFLVETQTFEASDPASVVDKL